MESKILTLFVGAVVTVAVFNVAWMLDISNNVAGLQNEVTHLASKVDLLETEQKLLEAIGNIGK